tara:strand:+ start:883 stop:1134 length:252 start_codon:yes stop_codon:yes gene_type:complete
MEQTNQSKWKKVIDNILILNVFILITGSIFLGFSFILSLNGNSDFLKLFNKLWYPLFIPSLSLFFSAILVEAILNSIINRDKS